MNKLHFDDNLEIQHEIDVRLVVKSATKFVDVMEYVVIFEKGENSYGASVPDLPGCIAVAETMEEVRKLIAEAIEFHIEGLQEDGDVVPSPSSNLPVQSDPAVSSALITVHV